MLNTSPNAKCSGEQTVSQIHLPQNAPRVSVMSGGKEIYLLQFQDMLNVLQKKIQNAEQEKYNTCILI